MFTKLRNRILLLNAVTICVVMAVSFAAVYLLTEKSVGDLTYSIPQTGDQLMVVSGSTEMAIYSDATDAALEEGSVDFEIATGAAFADDGEASFSVMAEGEGAAGGTIEGVIDGESVSGAGVVAINVAASERSLRGLMWRLILIGAIVLVVVVLVSRVFADRAMRPVREAYERQRRFVADASHELKTPLMTISANHEALLAHPGETVASQREWIDSARTGTERMSSLLSQLLALATAEGDDKPAAATGAERGKTGPVDVGAMVRDEFALLRAQAERRGLDVNGASEPDDAENGIVYNLTPDAAGDLRRVVATLSDNAVKYADDGGDVTWSVAEEKGAVTIEITNTGPGIAPEDLPHIFERFYRSDKARTAGEGGYGLGLSIAQAICKGRGWTVSAESDPEKITSFRITLPPRSL